MKKNSLLMVLTFLLGASVLLFLLGLRNRTKPIAFKSNQQNLEVDSNQIQDTPAVKVSKNSLEANESEEEIKSVEVTTTLEKAQSVTLKKEVFSKEIICPLVESKINHQKFLSKLDSLGLKASSFKVMRENLHVLTEDSSKIKICERRRFKQS